MAHKKGPGSVRNGRDSQRQAPGPTANGGQAGTRGRARWSAGAPGWAGSARSAAVSGGARGVWRRLSTGGQGGWRIAIADAVTFLSSEAAGGINGRTLRVCGQNFVGA